MYQLHCLKKCTFWEAVKLHEEVWILWLLPTSSNSWHINPARIIENIYLPISKEATKAHVGIEDSKRQEQKFLYVCTVNYVVSNCHRRLESMHQAEQPHDRIHNLYKLSSGRWVEKLPKNVAKSKQKILETLPLEHADCRLRCVDFTSSWIRTPLLILC